MSWVNTQTGSYALQPQDNNKLLVLNSSSAATVTLPQPGVTEWVSGEFELSIASIGAGAVTLSPASSTIDGQSSLTLNQYDGIKLQSGGVNWFTVRGVASGGGGSYSGDATSIQGIAVSSTTPTTGQVLEYNGSQYAPATPSGGSGSGVPTWVFDLMYANPSAASNSPTGPFGLWTNGSEGSITLISSGTAYAGHNGLWELTQSPATNAWSSIQSPAVFSGGSSNAFKIVGAVYSAASANGLMAFGFGANGNSPNPTYEVSFHCDPTGLGNNNWWAFINNNGTTTTQDTGVSADGVWHQLEIVITSGTSVTFYIDGVSVGTGTAPSQSYAIFAATWEKTGSSPVPAMVIDWIAAPVDNVNVSQLI